MSSIAKGHHLAAVLPSKGCIFELTHRSTPTPGPNELLIEVKAIALNHLDRVQRDIGYNISHYPAVGGHDLAGVVASAGSDVDSDAPKPGTRVAAFAPCFFVQGLPNYGAFQKFVLVPAENVVPLPQNMSFNEASLLPMAAATTWSAWYTLGLPQDASYTPEDKKGMLVWGASSSIGSAGVQIARSMGFHVYATASEKHHECIKQLGASKVFDYKDEHVIENIVNAAREDGVTIQFGYDAVGSLHQSVAVLKELKSDAVAKLASGPRVPDDAPKIEGVEVKFVVGPTDELKRSEHFHFIFNVWLKEKLDKGDYVPSPRVRVLGGGLEAINRGLDELKKGVSGEKLVIEV